MWSFLQPSQIKLVDRVNALVGRDEPIIPDQPHAVFNINLLDFDPRVSPRFGEKRLILGMGCFWGAERLFWRKSGVLCTSVGYAGGYTLNPTYQEVCTGQTGHTEVVQIDYDPQQVSVRDLLKLFWENHDPTQGMRQGNDVGTQYRSAIYWTDESQKSIILESVEYFEQLLKEGKAKEASQMFVSTEVKPLDKYYFAETDHQQYLHKNPHGYCGLKGTGAVCAF